MMKQNIIALENFTFSFSDSKRPFFYDLNASFAQGKIHVIRGRNGVGKSTLFRILQGKLYRGEQCSGTIIFEGERYTERNLCNSKLIHAVHLVPQKFDLALADQCSFAQNIALAQIPFLPRLSRLPRERLLPTFIKRFGIDFNKRVDQLSGGQRQILAILMALQKSRKILLLDEPTAALDEKNARMVFTFLEELISKTQMTILIICHDRELVERFSPHGHFEIKVDPENDVRRICFDAT